MGAATTSAPSFSSSIAITATAASPAKSMPKRLFRAFDEDDDNDGAVVVGVAVESLVDSSYDASSS